MDTLIRGARRLGFDVNRRQVGQFETYYEELIAWNARINLTAITRFEDVVVKHFLDSLTVTMAIPPERGYAGLRVIDVGTGAGMPGLPLKILLPQIRLSLLESTAKKCAFLRHTADRLGLEAEIVTGRAEDAARDPHQRETYEVVLSRAVAALPSLAELTLPLCAIGGVVIAQKQAEAKAEIGRAIRAVDIMGGRLGEVIDIELPELTGRCLITYDKISPTPPEYPRRAGVPAKRPIV